MAALAKASLSCYPMSVGRYTEGFSYKQAVIIVHLF